MSETERNNGAALLYLTCGRSASTHSSPRQMPAAPATAPRHGEMGQSACPMLPGKLPTGLCPSPGNARYQPSTAASFCPSCCLFAQQSPKARPHTCWPSRDRQALSQLLCVLYAGDQDLQELHLPSYRCYSPEVKPFAILFFQQQLFNHVAMRWSNHCHPVVLGERPQPQTRTWAPGCWIGNYHPEFIGSVGARYE